MLLSAVADPNRVLPLKSFTVDPASAVPVIVGVGSFELDLFSREEGASGAVVSIVIVKLEAEDVLPAAS